MACLTNIVGITDSSCDCIISGLTSDEITALAISNSGLYLDDLPGGVHMKALNNIDACKTFKEMATGARDNAIKMLEDDLIVAISNKYSKSKRAFVGEIGRMSYATTLGTTKRYQAIRIQPWDYSDGLITLNRFNIAVNATVNFTLRLYRVPKNSVMGEEVTNWPITATANAWFTQNLTTPLKMPLIYNGDLVEYWFIYDLQEPGTPFLPKDNKIECSTCDQASGRLGDFVNVWGVQFDDLNALNDHVNDIYGHGMSLSVSIKCDNESLFCREYNDQDAIAVTMAHAVRFKAGELLIEEVLKSPDVNRYITMAREYNWGKRNHFRSEYDGRIQYLSETINVDESNCYVCRETANQPFKAGIFK